MQNTVVAEIALFTLDSNQSKDLHHNNTKYTKFEFVNKHKSNLYLPTTVYLSIINAFKGNLML